MSTVAVTSPAPLDADDRAAFRITGWMIAVSAATVLWGAIGVGIWSVVSLVA